MSNLADTLLSHGDVKKDTLVVVLGWAGAKERNLEKYCELYRSRGYTTIQFIASSLVPGWGVKNGRNVGEIGNVLKKGPIQDFNRLIFHCFSMNGFLTLCALDLQFPDLRVLERCDGLFLDSCPMHTADFALEHVKQHCLVMNQVYGNGKGLSGIVKRLVTLQYTLASIRDNILVKIGAIDRDTVSAFHYTLNHPDLPPVISMVYSKADTICIFRYMDEWAAGAAKRGCEIISICHVDSSHCEHFRKYPDVYTRQLDEFIRMIERNQRGVYRSKI